MRAGPWPEQDDVSECQKKASRQFGMGVAAGAVPERE